MSEILGVGGEFLSPADKFTHTIDAHFHAIGGSGISGRAAEEVVHLVGVDNTGLPGPRPQATYAQRPIPGQEEQAAQFWPTTCGHRVNTVAYAGDNTTEYRLYFVRDGELWIAWEDIRWRSVGPMRSSASVGYGEMQLRADYVPPFLAWLGRAVPLLPQDPKGSPG